MTDLTKMTQAQLIAHIQAMEERNKAAQFFRCKVSEKGCLSVFASGLRRMGATFYAQEWEVLLANVDKIRAAIAEGDKAKALSRK